MFENLFISARALLENLSLDVDIAGVASKDEEAIDDGRLKITDDGRRVICGDPLFFLP
jgi:hypothetical protein